MTLHFEVRPAAKCAKKDVIDAIGIYSSAVDSGSRTDTNQIKSYIWNTHNNHSDRRDLFFICSMGITVPWKDSLNLLFSMPAEY